MRPPFPTGLQAYTIAAVGEDETDYILWIHPLVALNVDSCD
jgi:hypothetical protein